MSGSVRWTSSKASAPRSWSETYRAREAIYETFVVTQRAEALFTHVHRELYPARADAYGADVRGRLEAAAGVTISDYFAAAAERQRSGPRSHALLRDADLAADARSAARRASSVRRR